MTSICKDASSPSSFSFCTTGTPESHGSPFIRDFLQKFGYLTLAKPLFRPLISDITSTKHQKLPTELPEEFRTVPDASSPLRKRFECRWSCRFNVFAAVWGVHRWVEGNVIGTCHVNILVYDWGYLREQSRIQKLSWIQKLGFRNFFVGFRNFFVGFRNFFVGFRNFVFRNFLGGFRNSLRWIQKLFSLDSETFFVGFRIFFRWIQKLFFVGFRNFFRWIQKLFSLDSETFFVGFRNFFRWIQKLFSLDSETFFVGFRKTFFVGFRNFFRWIQKLFSLDSETFFRGFTTPTHGRCHTRSGPRVGWGGVGWYNVLWPCTHGRCYTRSKAGAGGVGWDDNVLWPWTHSGCYTRSTAGVGWGGVGW